MEIMEKEHLRRIKTIEAKINIMYSFLFFIVGFLSLATIGVLDDKDKVDNLSTEIIELKNKIEKTFQNPPLEKMVTLTVYNPVESQCDDTPLVTANGTKIDLEKLKKGEIKYCAVSRDLLPEIPYGSIIYIEGHGEYEVVDTMNRRIKMGVDILQDVSEKGFKKTNIRILKVK